MYPLKRACVRTIVYILARAFHLGMQWQVPRAGAVVGRLLITTGQQGRGEAARLHQNGAIPQKVTGKVGVISRSFLGGGKAHGKLLVSWQWGRRMMTGVRPIEGNAENLQHRTQVQAHSGGAAGEVGLEQRPRTFLPCPRCILIDFEQGFVWEEGCKCRHHEG